MDYLIKGNFLVAFNFSDKKFNKILMTIKIKIISKLLLIVFLILSLIGVFGNYAFVFNVLLFLLFFILTFIAGHSFNYISFIIGLSGVIIFNPILPLEFSDYTMRLIDIGYLVIVNLWALIDAYIYFDTKNFPDHEYI